MLANFNGVKYRLATNWFNKVHLNNSKEKPLVYLEIGTFYGANLLSVAATYGSHPESKLYCIDPWEDYAEYPEYKNEQPKRGYSNLELPKFQDDFFDLIYIDGNHEPEFVLEDAVLSFRKLKKGGVMIFDDYGWGGPDLTQRGIDAFVSGYHKRILNLGHQDNQVFIQKI